MLCSFSALFLSWLVCNLSSGTLLRVAQYQERRNNVSEECQERRNYVPEECQECWNNVPENVRNIGTMFLKMSGTQEQCSWKCQEISNNVPENVRSAGTMFLKMSGTQKQCSWKCQESRNHIPENVRKTGTMFLKNSSSSWTNRLFLQLWSLCRLSKCTIKIHTYIQFADVK